MMWLNANLIYFSLKKSIHYLAFTDHCREDANKLSVVAWYIDKLLQIVVAKTFCWENNYSIFRTMQNWTNLFFMKDFVRSSICQRYSRRRYRRISIYVCRLYELQYSSLRCLLNVDFLIQKRWVGPTIRFQSLVRPSHSLMTESLITCLYRLLVTLSHESELMNRVRVAVSESNMIDRDWCSLEWDKVDRHQIWSIGLDALSNRVESIEIRYSWSGLMLFRMRSSWSRSGMISRA
jgi:hypothetical protein